MNPETWLGKKAHPHREPEDGGTTVLTPALSSEERENRSQRLGKVVQRVVQGFNARIVRGTLSNGSVFVL
jgi:hypothetical protein